MFAVQKKFIFSKYSSCAGLAVCELDIQLTNRKHCRSPREHSVKSLQQFVSFLKKQTEMAPAAAVFKYCVYSILCRTARIFLLSSIGRSTLIPPHTIETFW